jgi:hypothetical protein
MTINREKWREEILPRLIPEMRNLSHGFSVADGWKTLVCDLIDHLDTYGVSYDILQIKEKFGGLRFYCQLKDRKGAFPAGFAASVMKAEGDSLLICEDCGAPGTRLGDGWIRTLCPACDAAFKKRRAERV